jgi:NAD(P)-dependent dehydrogenase (short-subunit alcohol dehydrogenase family)
MTFAGRNAVVTGAGGGIGLRDYVVNAAGVGWFGRDGSLVDTEPGVWERVLEVNLTAAMHVSRCAVPLMRGAGGALVHIASVAGLRNFDAILR